MKRPFVSVVSCYVLGLLLGHCFQPPVPWLFAISAAAFGACVAFEKARPFLLWPLLLVVGWTNLIFHAATLSPDDLRVRVGNDARIVTVRGTIAATPRVRIIERHGDKTEHSITEVRVSEIRGDSDWQPAFGEIVVQTPSALPETFFAGQSTEIAGVIAPPPGPLAEGLFDGREYLATRGIYYRLQTASTNDWTLRDPVVSAAPSTERFLRWSQGVLAAGMPVEDEAQRLLWAMTLGWRTAFTGDVADPFLRAGTMHLFAIDGLRIALISGMLVALLQVLQLSRAWCGAIAIPVIWFYTAATGWESSAVRASIMMTIVLGGWSLKRPGDTLNSLAAAAFLILLWEPRQLFEAGFQLSFFVMLTIGLLLQPLNRFTDGRLRPDPVLPEELLPKWRRLLWSSLRAGARYFSLSLAAWIGSIPLSAKYFHLFSPVSPLANLVAVPLGTLALMADLGALMCGTWFTWGTERFNNAAWFFMNAMTDVSEWATRIPGAYFYVPEPSWISIVLFYAVLVLWWSGWLSSPGRKVIAATASVIVVAAWFCHWELTRPELTMTVLPLNGGHAVYVAGRDGEWLIDSGNAAAVESTVKPFLRGQGVNHIPRLALTGGNIRNYGGAGMLDELFGVDELWTSPAHFRSSGYNEIVSKFEAPDTRHRTVSAGERVRGWQVLWPGATNHFARADDDALVLRTSCRGTRILLLGDLGRAGQSALLSLTNDLSADIVVAGLPDDEEPLSEAMLAAIHPKVIVIADSEYPASRRSKPGLKERLEQKAIPVIYTRTAGAVKVDVDKNGWCLTTMDGRRFSSVSSSR